MRRGLERPASRRTLFRLRRGRPLCGSSRRRPRGSVPRSNSPRSPEDRQRMSVIEPNSLGARLPATCGTRAARTSRPPPLARRQCDEDLTLVHEGSDGADRSDACQPSTIERAWTDAARASSGVPGRVLAPARPGTNSRASPCGRPPCAFSAGPMQGRAYAATRADRARDTVSVGDRRASESDGRARGRRCAAGSPRGRPAAGPSPWRGAGAGSAPGRGCRTR
jgi:hypothetical protein